MTDHTTFGFDKNYNKPNEEGELYRKCYEVSRINSNGNEYNFYIK